MNNSLDRLLYRLQPIYNRWIRQHLPRTTRSYNGVTVKDRAIFDRTVSYPDFEAESINQLTNAINRGDRVVVVGGGRGVSAVYAAKSEAFHVRVYEGAIQSVNLCQDTMERNGVTNRVSVEHTIVGTDLNAWGSTNNASQLSSEDLPPCDVIELDCEGSEVEILKNLGPRPQSIIVECHPHYGAPESEVRNALPQEYYIAARFIDRYDGLPVLRAELE